MADLLLDTCHHALLDERDADTVEHVGKVEFHPRQDGRNMVMVLAPDKQAQARYKKQQEKEAQEAADQDENEETDAQVESETES